MAPDAARSVKLIIISVVVYGYDGGIAQRAQRSKHRALSSRGQLSEMRSTA